MRKQESAICFFGKMLIGFAFIKVAGKFSKLANFLSALFLPSPLEMKKRTTSSFTSAMPETVFF
jgi:hypothetical protein